MEPDERTEFLSWMASLPIPPEIAQKLLPHLPADADVDPELPNWIESARRIIGLNNPEHGFGLPKEPIDEGFLIIGWCPNGDLVAVNFRDPRLPVFYISHEQMHSSPLSEVIRRVADSIEDYDEALGDENSGIPLDYWHDPKR
jgi:hypothetical protein